MTTIKIKRGNRINLPTLAQGELAYCWDTNQLWIGSPTGNRLVSCGCEAGEGDVVTLDGDVGLQLALEAQYDIPLQGNMAVQLVLDGRYTYRREGNIVLALGGIGRTPLRQDGNIGVELGANARFPLVQNGNIGLELSAESERQVQKYIRGNIGIKLAANARYPLEQQGNIGMKLGAEAEFDFFDGPIMPDVWTLTITNTADDTCSECEIFNDDFTLGQSTATLWTSEMIPWNCPGDDNVFFRVVRIDDSLTVLLAEEGNPAFSFATWGIADISSWNGIDPLTLEGGENNDDRCDFPDTVTITPA